MCHSLWLYHAELRSLLLVIVLCFCWTSFVGSSTLLDLLTHVRARIEDDGDEEHLMWVTGGLSTKDVLTQGAHKHKGSTFVNLVICKRGTYWQRKGENEVLIKISGWSDLRNLQKEMYSHFTSRRWSDLSLSLDPPMFLFVVVAAWQVSYTTLNLMSEKALWETKKYKRREKEEHKRKWSSI